MGKGLIAFSKGVKQSLLEGGKLLKSGLTKEKMLQALEKSGVVVNGAGSLIDEVLLNTAKAFDDNVLDVASVGFANWKIFQNRVYGQLKNLYPGKRLVVKLHQILHTLKMAQQNQKRLYLTILFNLK